MIKFVVPYTDRVIIQDFSPLKNFVRNECIVYNGILYKALLDVVAGPFDSSMWEAITSTKIENFLPNHEYVYHEIMLHNNTLYRANQAFRSTEILDFTKFETILQAGAVSTVNTILPNDNGNVSITGEQIPIDSGIGAQNIKQITNSLTNQVNNKVSKLGDTMSGDLLLASDNPPNNLSATPKIYVDDKLHFKELIDAWNITSRLGQYNNIPLLSRTGDDGVEAQLTFNVLYPIMKYNNDQMTAFLELRGDGLYMNDFYGAEHTLPPTKVINRRDIDALETKIYSYVDEMIIETQTGALKYVGQISLTQPLEARNGEYWYEADVLPTTFPIEVKVYDSTQDSWDTFLEYTPILFHLWHRTSDTKGYYWFGDEWNMLDFSVDLSQYYTKNEVDDLLEDKVDTNGTDSLMSVGEHTKLASIALGAEPNKISTILKPNGEEIPIRNKTISLDVDFFGFDITRIVVDTAEGNSYNFDMACIKPVPLSNNLVMTTNANSHVDVVDILGSFLPNIKSIDWGDGSTALTVNHDYSASIPHVIVAELNDNITDLYSGFLQGGRNITSASINAPDLTIIGHLFVYDNLDMDTLVINAPNLVSIDAYFMQNSPQMRTLLIKSNNVVTLGQDANISTLTSIRVPDSLVESYKVAPIWSTKANIITRI